MERLLVRLLLLAHRATAKCDDAAVVRPFATRTSADIARCRAARCATGAVRNLALRFTTFENELLVATPHKAGSRYVVESLAQLYNCTLARRWYGEARRCGESDADPVDVSRYFVVAVVRDPVERVVASYDHVAAPGTLQRFCQRNESLSDAERAYYASKPGDHIGRDRRVDKFVRWLGCLGRVRDLGRLSAGLEFRHVQPFARYAFAAEASVVARVEALDGVARYLAGRLPILRARAARPGVEWPSPWLSAANRSKLDREALEGVHYMRGSQARSPWSLTACDLAKSDASEAAEASIRRLFATDWACFGDVLPPLPDRTVAFPAYVPDDNLAPTIKADVPPALAIPEVFPECPAG